ncbi:hypothetical protein BAUCODRAFT_150514 [Baudoinia panamericana UAMH 10762]|uniref:BTB domain-containing protein n=1 Tax=Baudoinia panamericana (strain UAMH 10762) TaxID=717646 RepID=M2N374_BAUPA|nr:uncharacterized protein BAUCODRAFT_150514 [Baudoinia panamericana UAMH 10762]EMC93145.1 hypothetical protein BAUCODRAFT_150514 [Baudoinia panamericana UAMH 10762]
MASRGSRGFPQFHDGDCEIWLTREEKLVLHGAVLRIHSDFFKAALDERWSNSAPSANPATLNDGRLPLFGIENLSTTKRTTIFELRFEKDSSGGQLYRKGVALDNRFQNNACGHRSKEASAASSEMASGSPGAARLTRIRAHKDMLGTLYHWVPSIAGKAFNKTRIAVEALAKCVRKEALASCAREPLRMLRFAVAVKSEWACIEAATNVIGRGHKFWKEATAVFEELGIGGMMAVKRDVFIRKLKDCDWELFNTSTKSADRDHTEQLAVHFFHHWLRDKLSQKFGSRLDQSFERLYHYIASEECYPSLVRKHRFRKFLKESNLDSKYEEACTQDQALDVVWLEARKIVEPLLVDLTELGKERRDVWQTLTCVTLERGDLPWVKNEER